MGEIVLTGLSFNDPVPGSYLEISFAQGEAAGDGSPIEVLLMGNALSTGSATDETVVYGPDTIVQLQTEADAISLFGAGSELHRMFRRFVAVNRDTTVRAIAVADSAGAQATGTITYATSATAAGSTRLYVHDEFVEVSIASGDSPTTVAAAVKAEVNKMTHWGVTADNSSGVLTLTAKHAGLRGNEIRYMPVITAGIGMTVSPTTDTAMSGGTTADSYTNALATIANQKYYYIVSAAPDSTNFGALVTQLGTQASPTTGIRQRAIAGSTDTISNTTTIAIARNSARADIIWAEKNPWTSSELATHLAAVVTKYELKPNPKTNFASFGNSANTQPYWPVPRPRLDSAIPSRTNIKSALNNGISPVGVNPNGSTYLVNLVTTRSLNGSQNDYRIRDHHKVTICDFFGEDLLAKSSLNFEGRRIADDPPEGARAPGPLVVTPRIFKGAIFGLLDEYDGNDLLQNLQAIKDGTIVQRAGNPRTRMTARIPLQPIDNAYQFAIAVDQVA